VSTLVSSGGIVDYAAQKTGLKREDKLFLLPRLTEQWTLSPALSQPEWMEGNDGPKLETFLF